MISFGRRVNGSRQKERAAEPRDCEGNDRRQRKPWNAEVSKAGMFGSDSHIVFSQSNSVLEPSIWILWKSTICSAEGPASGGPKFFQKPPRYSDAQKHVPPK